MDDEVRVSTRGRYGLRAMFELARSFGKPPVLMSTVAERQGLSRKYLHALLTALKAAGLVRSVRGAGGGFVLTRPPAQITLGEVLGALEGPLSLVHCVSDKRACDRASACPTRRVWRELSGAIEGVLDSVTLEDLVTRDERSPAPAGRLATRRKPGTDPRGSHISKPVSRLARTRTGTK